MQVVQDMKKLDYIPVAAGPKHFLNKTQVMLDIETMDTKRTAGIWQFGAAIWNPSSPDVVHTLSLTLNPYDVVEVDGISISQDTVDWLHKNCGEVFLEAHKIGFVDGGELKPKALRQVDLRNATLTFFDILGRLVDGKTDDALFWSKSISFDFPIIENWLTMLRLLPLPWKYWNVQELRTFMMLKEIPRTSFTHTAVEDAVGQLELILKECSNGTD